MCRYAVALNSGNMGSLSSCWVKYVDILSFSPTGMV